MAIWLYFQRRGKEQEEVVGVVGGWGGVEFVTCVYTVTTRMIPH